MKVINIALGDEQPVDLDNLVVIVGPNSSGKTRFLDELHAAITGRNRNSQFWDIRVNQVLITQEDENLWRNSLIQQKHLSGQIVWFSPFTLNNNSPDGKEISAENYEDIKQNPSNNFFNDEMILRKELTHYLDVGNRLSMQGSAQMQDPALKPTNMLEVLERRRVILIPEINNLLKDLFGKKLIFSLHQTPLIELSVCSQEIEEPPQLVIEDRFFSSQKYLKWKQDNKIGEITQEGHGVRAFLQIMFRYFLPTNQILMIDEPEAHLYPSIKRKFGKKIGDLSKKSKKQIFCVTHDSDFLQGIFDTHCSFTLLRLTRSKKKHQCYVYQHGSSLPAGKNQAEYLQIPFLDCAIIVEGATDRLVYEYIFSDNNFLSDKEYKFISAGGKDSLTNPETLAIKTNTPYIIIADMDVLKENQGEIPICTLAVVSKNESLRNFILKVSKKLVGIANLKKEGIKAINDKTARSEVEGLIEELEKKGIFIVPVGTLESWGDIQSDRHDFVEQFIKQYEKDKTKFDSLKDFMARIKDYALKIL